MPIQFRLLTALALILFATTSRAQPLVPDPAFTPPVIETTFPDWPIPLALTALPDGGVLVTTLADFVDAKPVAALCKLRADGSIDSSFRPPAFEGQPIVAHASADGRLLVYDGKNRLIRLLANGALDPSYQALPIVDSTGFRILPLSDGRLVATFGQRIVLLQPGGGTAPHFDLTGRAYDAFLQADGKIILAGTIIVGGTAPKVARVNPDGTIDAAFNSISALANVGDVRSVVAFPDGKVVIGSHGGAIRLLPDGAIDYSYIGAPDRFLNSGNISRLAGSSALYYYTAEYNSISALIPQLRRFDASGAPDAAFNVSGVAMPSTEQPQPLASWDGTSFYFMAAATTERAHRRLVLIRTDANGTIDANFNPRFSRRSALGWHFVRQPDNKYVVTGAFDHVNGTFIHTEGYNCVRLNADGSLDRGFQAPATVIVNQRVYSVLPQGIQPNGQLIVRGDGGIYRLNPNGSRDNTFPTLPEEAATVMADGSFIAAASNGRMTRYSRDGARDASFDAGSAYGLGFLAIAPDGKIYTGWPSRLMPNGAPDPSWVDASGINAPWIASYAMLANGSLLAYVEMRSSDQSPWYTRLVHLDVNGRRTLSVDVPNDLQAIARAAWEIVTANGGGDFKLEKRNSLQLAGVIMIRGREITIAPEMRANAKVAPPLASISRFLASSSVSPQSSLAPTILQQPVGREVTRGASITLTVQACGQLDFTYQWYKDGVPFRTATTSSGVGTLTLNNIQASDTGRYHAEVRNAAGSVASTVARIALAGSPTIVQEPASNFTLAPGQTVAMTVTLAGNGMRIRWLRGDTSVAEESGIDSGAHTSLFTVTETGVYRAVITNSEGENQTRDVIITVNPNASKGRLSNVSVRTEAGPDTRNLIVGFVVEGQSTASIDLLIRGIGPALEAFGVSDFMRDPRTVLRSGTAMVAANDNWGGLAQTRSVAARVGAFALLDEQSRDAALTPSVQTGAYTVQIDDAQGGTGTVLGEIYDASGTTAVARLINLSSRAVVRSNNAPLIAGFVIAGDTAQTLLMRGIGPGLTPFGVTDALPRAELSLFDSAGRKIAEATRASANLATVTQRVGAFMLSGSVDLNAALAITLPPGAYTAQVRGPTGTTGSALIEVYEIR